MKKNIAMRLASGIMLASLLSTCVISGTFAKYTTSDKATDTARVAQWGVTASVTGTAFATTYTIEDGGSGLSLAVKSSTEDKLVAPGTAGTFTGVSLTGTPEVAVKITKTATVELSDWLIDHDDDPETDNVYYCPIVVTINGANINGLDFDSAALFASAIKAAIEEANGEYDPGTNLANIGNMNGNYDWAWAFETSEDNNKKDTKLGDKTPTDTISIEVEVEVTQIN